MRSLRPAGVLFSRGRLAALAALVLVTAACGSPGTGSSQSPSPAATTPTPTASPVGLTFKLNGVNSTAKGTITASTQGGSFTVELKITGLAAASIHVSHIHVGSCEARGPTMFALNQVVADGQGDADTRTTLNARYPPASGHWYVVVHAGPDMQGTNSLYLLCGNLFK